MLRAAAALARRDLAIAWRRPGEAVLPLVFLATGVALFPLGVGPEPELLARMAGGVVWVLALFAVTLGIDRLWQAELEDGSLELLALGPLPLELVVLVKTLVHWLVTALPLVLLAPGFLLALRAPAELLWSMPLALLIGTPALALVAGIGAALLAGARRGAGLIALVALPLQIPVLIFGAAAVEAVASGLPASAPFLILAGLALLAIALVPFATAAALRLALE